MCIAMLFFVQNGKLVDNLKQIAERKGCTAGQLALSWVHHQGDDVFPIPGRQNKLVCNLASNKSEFGLAAVVNNTLFNIAQQPCIVFTATGA